MKPYLLRVLKNGKVCYTEKHNYFKIIKLSRKRRIFMKKMIVLFLCIAVLTCSVAAMPAMDVEAATKFGTHKFNHSYNGIYLFSNTLSANYEYVKGTKVRCVKGVYVGPVGISYQLYFEDCPTNWVKKKADYEADVRVHTSDMISYSAFQNLYCDTSGNITYASDLFPIYGSSK